MNIAGKQKIIATTLAGALTVTSTYDEGPSPGRLHISQARLQMMY